MDLLTLWEILRRFDIGGLITLIRAFEAAGLNTILSDKNPHGVSRTVVSRLKESPETLHDLGLTGFDSVKAQMDRMLRLIEHNHPWDEVEKAAIELVNRIQDECERHLFLYVSSERLTFYEQANGFGDKVANVFQDAILDIEEAGKCLALDRGTASVFHLMRVMEQGLRRVRGQLIEIGIQVSSANPTWEAVLQPIDKESAKNYQDKTEDWKRNEPYFAEVAALLRSVKIAWRNNTMHIDKTYTLEVAEDIFHAVKSFMSFLATAQFKGKSSP